MYCAQDCVVSVILKWQMFHPFELRLYPVKIKSLAKIVMEADIEILPWVISVIYRPIPKPRPLFVTPF